MTRRQNRGRLRSMQAAFRRLLLCLVILGIAPLWAAPLQAEARGLAGRVSKVVPFAGVVVGWRSRNRVYRSSERFIQDRNQYYDGLLEVAREQLQGREIMGLRRSQVAAYVKVYALIQQERTGQLEVAEARKREARAQFHERVEEAALYALAGSHLAREVITSMMDGVGSMQAAIDRAIGKLTSGGSDVLMDLRRIREISNVLSSVSSIVGGETGNQVAVLSGRISSTIQQAESGALELATGVKQELQQLNEVLSALNNVGRKPTAGDVIEHVSARFLPGSEQGSSIPLEAISSILSQLEVGDGSLKDEARKALNEGFVARCAEFSQSLQTQLDALRHEGQQSAGGESVGSACRAVARKRTQPQGEADRELGQLLEPEVSPEVLPRIAASGTLSEAMSGPVDPAIRMATTFELTVDFAAGTISGSLTGSRNAKPGGWINCYDPANPSHEYERVDVNSSESYTTSFSGLIDRETGEFSITIAPQGTTTGSKVSQFTRELCLEHNAKKWDGEQGWVGQGTISGGVSKDGGIELATDWHYEWFYGDVQVSGRWSGNGTASTP